MRYTGLFFLAHPAIAHMPGLVPAPEGRQRRDAIAVLSPLSPLPGRGTMIDRFTRGYNLSPLRGEDHASFFFATVPSFVFSTS